MGMSTRKVNLGCLPGYERKSAFKFSYGRLWILYFDRLPIYWCITPDSLISCDCCGEGCVEVKCPYCKRNDTVDKASNS